MKSDQLNSIIVRLKIDYEKCLLYYSGKADWVSCKSIDGRSVKFPARVIKMIVSENGVDGLYRLRFKTDGTFYDISRIKD